MSVYFSRVFWKCLPLEVTCRAVFVSCVSPSKLSSKRLLWTALAPHSFLARGSCKLIVFVVHFMWNKLSVLFCKPYYQIILQYLCLLSRHIRSETLPEMLQDGFAQSLFYFIAVFRPWLLKLLLYGGVSLHLNSKLWKPWRASDERRGRDKHEH